MLGFIGRLDYQKGVDLICESYDWLMDQGVQLVMLGSGREDLENALRSRSTHCITISASSGNIGSLVSGQVGIDNKQPQGLFSLAPRKSTS